MINRDKNGFTLVELMIAMSFLGILLITMVTAIIHISNLYNKGVAIKSINQAGRDVGSAIRRDASNISSVAEPIVQPSDASGWLGRMCLGGYTYLWSPADKLAAGTAVKYTSTSTPVIMARVADGVGAYCVKDGTGKYSTAVDKTTAQEMLPSENGDYAMHKLTLERIPPLGTAVAGETLYDVVYTIGTNDNGSIDTVDQSCKPPSGGDANANFDFCAVNEFELIIRAG